MALGMARETISMLPNFHFRVYFIILHSYFPLSALPPEPEQRGVAANQQIAQNNTHSRFGHLWRYADCPSQITQARSMACGSLPKACRRDILKNKSPAKPLIQFAKQVVCQRNNIMTLLLPMFPQSKINFYRKFEREDRVFPGPGHSQNY